MPLFDAYRQFYKKSSDLEEAAKFLAARLQNNESIIFLALTDDNKAIGFMQLYHGFSSVSLCKTLILNDLYIDANWRKQGIGRKLMQSAQEFAKLNKAGKISLQTAKTNIVGQKLYESEGYILDDEYLTYVLTL